MKHSFLTTLRRARLRPSPGFRLVTIEAVSELDRINLPDGGRASGWAAALVPRESNWRRAQLVTAETVALLESIARAGTAPPGFEDRVIARLLLDGILELEGESGFLSGPAAHALCFSRRGPICRGVLGHLSLTALQYAAALGEKKPRALAERLYRYNTLPASPLWRRRLPDTAAVTRLLSGRAAPRRPTRSRSWTTFVSAEPGAPVWEVWERSGAATPPPGAPTYKLYVSPQVTEVGEASRAVRALPAGCAPFALKLGGDLVTLLRSEKLVSYYAGLDELKEAADRLGASLRGMQAHGVPFTAELGAGGLLSWGADPGDLAEPPGPLRQTSWRRWITTRLGAALASALATGTPVPPWQYAIDRVSLDGVHPTEWTPPAWFWDKSSDHVDH